MKNTNITFTGNQLRSKISEIVAGYIAQGFTITEAFTNFNFPLFYLQRKNEKVKIDFTRETLNDGITELKFFANDTELFTAYGVTFVKGYDVYTDTLDNAIKVHTVVCDRRKRKHTDAVVTEIPVKAAINKIRTIKGFRTVAMKNMKVERIQRLNEKTQYRLTNTQHGNSVMF